MTQEILRFLVMVIILTVVQMWGKSLTLYRLSRALTIAVAIAVAVTTFGFIFAYLTPAGHLPEAFGLLSFIAVMTVGFAINHKKLASMTRQRRYTYILKETFISLLGGFLIYLGAKFFLNSFGP